MAHASNGWKAKDRANLRRTRLYRNATACKGHLDPVRKPCEHTQAPYDKREFKRPRPTTAILIREAFQE